MIDIETIKKYYKDDLVFMTFHASERLKERGIKVKEIREAVNNGEIIEQYPNDYPYPSCLILGITINKKYLHIVISDDGSKANIITAYYPSEIKWNSDYKTRKE